MKNKEWYILEDKPRLVYVTYFNRNPEKDYIPQWSKFLESNNITTDKIIKEEFIDAHLTKIHHIVNEDSIEQYSLVKFNFKGYAEDIHEQMVFKKDKTYVYLGEIPNMKSHCIVADYDTGILHCGYHCFNFDVINDV